MPLHCRCQHRNQAACTSAQRCDDPGAASSGQRETLRRLRQRHAKAGCGSQAAPSKEHYETGHIDTSRMRKPGCGAAAVSDVFGPSRADLSRYSRVSRLAYEERPAMDAADETRQRKKFACATAWRASLRLRILRLGLLATCATHTAAQRPSASSDGRHDRLVHLGR